MKVYGKWRYEQHADEGESIIVYIQGLQFYFDAFMLTSKKYCLKLTNDQEYIVTHIISENGF